MAITNFKGDIERNLQEQVAENYRLILEHYNIDRILEDYGIRVIGEATGENLLPDPLTYTGTYGDAYAVGATPPYSFYVFTRPFEGESDPHWFNLGRLAIQGPAGTDGKSAYQLAQEAGFEGTEEQWLASIKGETGQTGERGSKIFVVDRPINTTVGYLPGDVYIILSEGSDLNGTVATLANGVWETMGNITGPTGLQGNPGENGTPGDAVNIIGILTSEAQLPAPDSVARNSAYVVQDETGQWLYFITGTTTVIWSKVPFENGTTVTVEGLPVQVFDADTKVNKYTTNPGLKIVYGQNANGTEAVIAIGTSNTTMSNGRLAQYWPPTQEMAPVNGVLITSNPQQPHQCANKQYVDTEVAKKISIPSGTPSYGVIPSVTSTGATQYLYIDQSLGNGPATVTTAGKVVATYKSKSYEPLAGYNTQVLLTGTPTKDLHAANKKYVDEVTGWIHIVFANEGDTYTLEEGTPFELRTEGPQGININFDDASVATVNTMNYFGANPTTEVYGGYFTVLRSNTLTSFSNKQPVTIAAGLAKSGVYLRYIRAGAEVVIGV